MFLDQVLVTDHVEQQVNDAELFGDADLAFGLGGGRGDQATGDQAGAQADAGREAAECFAHDESSADQNGASPWMVVR